MENHLLVFSLHLDPSVDPGKWLQDNSESIKKSMKGCNIDYIDIYGRYNGSGFHFNEDWSDRIFGNNQDRQNIYKSLVFIIYIFDNFPAIMSKFC